MEIEELGTAIELRVAYLCAYSKEFLFEVSSEYSKGLLANRGIERIVLMCIRFYEKYTNVPGDKLPELITNAAGLNKIPDAMMPDIRLVLESFKNQEAPTDIEYEINEAFRYFTKQSVVLVSEEAQELCSKGQMEEAAKILSEVIPVQRKRLGGGSILDAEDEEIDALFNDVEERLIQLPGELGKLMNNTLVRHGFVSLFGRNKVGKSHWLIYLARMARNQKRKTIFISTGDMTRRQCEKRILQGDAHTTYNQEYVSKQRMPCLDCVKNQNGTCFKRDGSGDCLNEFNEIDPVIKNPDYQPCTKCDDCQQAVSYRKVKRDILDSETVKRLRDKWSEIEGRGTLHVESFTSGNLTCSVLSATISKICKKYGWDSPDVVVIDYADIMADEGKDERASVNKRWKYLRGLADTHKCLIVTATQANSSSFDFEDLTLRAFSEDRRKLDHVTAFFAINQRPEERQQDIWRIAALNKREHPFNEAHQAACYGCLALGVPHIVSHHKFSVPPKPSK